MKYYRITCYTPFCGEENDYYYATDDLKDLEEYADECAYINGNEWYDESALEEQDMTEDDYYAECGCTVEEIDEEEFRRQM